MLECISPTNLYDNASKEENTFLKCFIEKHGLRADPTKVKAIIDWPIPNDSKDLRKWVGLANYLQKYNENYADTARSLTNLLKKDADWRWDNIHANAFRALKERFSMLPLWRNQILITPVVLSVMQLTSP